MFRNFLSLLKRYTTSVILSSVGLIVAFTAVIIILTQVHYELGYDKFHSKSKRIFRAEIKREGDVLTMPFWPKPFIDGYVTGSPHIESFSPISFNWSKADIAREDGSLETFRFSAWGVYPAFTDIFDFKMVEGSVSSLDEPGTALIPLSMAKEMFPGKTNVVGSQIGKMTVGGVYKDFPANSVIENNLFFKQVTETTWNQSNYFLMLLLDSKKSKKDVEQVLGGSDRFKEQFKENASVTLRPISEIYYSQNVWNDNFEKGNKTTTYTLLLIALLVLAIATINYINFSSAMASKRIKSINTQKIMGATNGSLRLKLLFEAVAISFLSYLLGLLIAYAISNSSLDQYLVWDMNSKLRPGFILLTGMISIIVGFIAGAFPAWKMTSVPPIMALKGSIGTSPKGSGYRSVLIGIQFAVSSLLIIVAVFLNIQNRFVSNYNVGFDKSRVAYFEMPQEMVSSGQAIRSSLNAIGGIEDVAFAYQPLGLGDSYDQNWALDFRDGQIGYTPMPVTWNFMDVMGIKVTEGRDFSESDEQRETISYIFNETSRNQYGMILDENISSPGKFDFGQIVGFADKELKTFSLRTQDKPMAFQVCKSPDWLSENMKHCYVRTLAGVNRAEVKEAIESTVRSIRPNSPSVNVMFMDDIADQVYAKEHKINTLITMYSIMAIIISLIGVFGLVLFETQYRRKEIGIRRVLGASVYDILVIINSKFMIILIVSMVIALPAGYYAVSKWLSSFAYKTSLHWWIFALTALVIIAVTVATITLRSLKSANENPVNSINKE